MNCWLSSTAAPRSAAADVGADLGRLAAFPFEEQLKDHHMLAVNVDPLPRQRLLDFAPHFARIVSAVVGHRPLCANVIDVQTPFGIAVKLKGHWPVAVLLHSFAIELLNLAHYTIDSLAIVRLWFPVGGNEIDDPQHRTIVFGGPSPLAARPCRPETRDCGDDCSNQPHGDEESDFAFSTSVYVLHRLTVPASSILRK